MKKLVNTIKNINFEKLLIAYILFQPIIDIITSLCVRYISPSLTLGILARSLFLVFTLIYAFIISDKKFKKLILIYCSILFLYIIAFLANHILNIGLTLIVTQLKAIIKVFYFSILLIAFIPIMKKISINNKYLIYCLLGYVGIIGITTICGIGFDSYADGSSPGKNGLFYAANEIGTIICILIPFLLLDLINIKSIVEGKKPINKQLLIELITLFFVIIVALWMGTKVPFLGLILALLVAFGLCIINIIKKKYVKTYLCKAATILAIFLVIFSIVSYSPIGKNLGISINKIVDISNNKESSEKPSSKNPSHSSVETVILSSRDVYYKNTLEDYKNSSAFSKLVGLGYVDNQNGQFTERKIIEIDYLDILFSNGIIGFIIFFAPLVVLLIYIAILLWKNKKFIFENNIIFYIYSIFIALIIARLSGHLFTAPAVSFYLVLIINKLINILKDKKNETI